jgi:murein DD-endopeptidase MepM/ murein hydrolase activator NlpD
VVGFFPGATHRRLAAFLAALILAVAALASPFASADDDLKEKQKKVKQQISSANSDLNESSAALRQAALALREAQAALSSAQAKLADTRAKLTVAEIRDRQMQAKLDAAVLALAQAREELQQGKEDLEVQRDALGEAIAQMYEQGTPGMRGIESFLEAQGLDDMTRVAAANESISDEEHAILAAFRTAEVLLTVKEAKVEAKKGEVEIQRQKAAENLKLMQALEKQAEAEEASVRSLVGQRSAALRAAEQAKAHDRQILVGLRAEEDRIAEMLRKRALAAAKNHKGPAGPSGGFLSYPVNGYITSPFGYRIHPIYGYYSLHNGVDFGASCGAPMYASAGGRVISQYYQSAWGNRLIIDHGWQRGVGLATIYNHATHYVVGVGQHVDRGQLVGYVGSTGWSTGCHLHFTVMANGVAVDPMRWF